MEDSVITLYQQIEGVRIWAGPGVRQAKEGETFLAEFSMYKGTEI